MRGQPLKKTKDNKTILDERTVFWFGEYRDKKITEVAVKNPTYIINLQKSSKFFHITDNVIQLAKDNCNVTDYVDIKNIFKN